MNKFIKKISDFEWAAIKLSVFYVLIAMAISISFSIVIYNISALEVGQGIGRTFRMINSCAPGMLPPGIENLEHARIKQLDEINDHLQHRLAYFNLIILILSSALSYFLAKKTLHPLEQAMDSQNRFSADASHELRTPLAAMRTEIEVALRDKKMTLLEAKELLKSNIEEVAKLESLSDALLKLARYQNGNFEMHKTNVSEILIDAYEKIEVLAKNKDIVFENELKDVYILADKQSLEELFIILLDNAIKYSDKGKKIEIKVTQINKKVVVSIKDYGSGIPKADLPNIFERFYRSDSSRDKVAIDGYGLGLSLAKQIVDLHDGKISVESIIGKGSEFKISLPQYKS